MALGSEHDLECRQRRQHAVGARAVAHRTDVPDLALQRHEAGADLDAEIVQKRRAQLVADCSVFLICLVVRLCLK